MGGGDLGSALQRQSACETLAGHSQEGVRNWGHRARESRSLLYVALFSQWTEGCGGCGLIQHGRAALLGLP